LRHFTETFAELGLTQKQVSVLWLVDDHPGIAQTDLAQRLQMDRATTMAIINRLQAKQLLRRDRSAHDGRKQALYLEPEGHAMLARAKLAIGEHEAWVKRHFSDAEVKVLIELLSRIHE
jgi:DNA-binding MarR family transcriptional regulator